jgi:hypothetical protein
MLFKNRDRQSPNLALEVVVVEVEKKKKESEKGGKSSKGFVS